jgi:3-oxoacyl-[acyl-carrier protein] reductase
MNEPAEFRGMTAVVTGASSGIGAETAYALGSRGTFVLIHYHHNQEGAEEVLQRIRDASGDGLLLQADLNRMEGIRCLIEQVRKTGRAIDILVNNAGSLIKRTRFLEITEDLWNMV